MAGGSTRKQLTWLPAFPEILLAILLLTLFGRVSAWDAVLGDADTGWHIRTGEFILNSGTVPVRDLYSFSRPDQPWFAWEWLADVAFAALHRLGGLEAVAALCITVLCASAAIVLTWLLHRGAGLWVALLVTLAVVSASSIHYLARPHVFSILFFPLAIWLLDADCRGSTARLWLLVPLSAVWANLHGGFVAWLATLSLLPLAMAIDRDWRRFWRYLKLAALCAAATLLNPYGWKPCPYRGVSGILLDPQQRERVPVAQNSLGKHVGVRIPSPWRRSPGFPRALARGVVFGRRGVSLGAGRVALSPACPSLRGCSGPRRRFRIFSPMGILSCPFPAAKPRARLLGLRPRTGPLAADGIVDACLGRARALAGCAVPAHLRFSTNHISGCGGGTKYGPARPYGLASADSDLRPVGRLPDLSPLPPPAGIF